MEYENIVIFIMCTLAFDILVISLFIKGTKFIYKIIRDGLTSAFKKDVVVVQTTSRKVHGPIKNARYVDVTPEKLKEFNTDDVEGFKNHLYDIFYKFEQAYNNLDYDTMKFLSSQQLYQNYYMGISLDLKLGKKRIIENIQKNKVILYEIDSTIAKQSAALMIEISYINYMVDKNGQIISGYRETPITEKFEVEFRKYFNPHDVVKCKNCGAVVEGNTCQYCRTKVQTEEFRICSIRKIIEKNS